MTSFPQSTSPLSKPNQQPILAHKQRTFRRLLGIVSAVSFILCIACVGFLMQRIIAFHDASPRHFFRFQPVNDRTFIYANRPVTFQDEHETGQADTVIVTYGDQTLRIRRTIAAARDGLPGLLDHADWLRVMRFADASGMTDNEFVKRLGTPELPDRLLIMTRSSRPGAEPETWGLVWKRDWIFDFYELQPDGSFTHGRLKHPTAYRMKEPKPGELRENTWQYQAAMNLMPRSGPTKNFRLDALGAASWTLPASMFAGLLGVVSLFFAIAPGTKKSVSWKRQTPTASPNTN